MNNEIENEFIIMNCPYCQCKEVDVLDFDHPSGTMMYYVSCNLCHASGPEYETPEAAISEWNRVASQVRNENETQER